MVSNNFMLNYEFPSLTPQPVCLTGIFAFQVSSLWIQAALEMRVPFEGGLRQRKAILGAERKPELEERDAAIA